MLIEMDERKKYYLAITTKTRPFRPGLKKLLKLLSLNIRLATI